jgi:hypothetical protein
MKKHYLFIYLLCLCPFLADAQIQLSNEKPVAGEAVTISLDQPETQVVIAYRPNSSVVRRDTLRSDGPTSEFSWTPQKAGVVALSTSSASRNVSVRFEGFSYPGLVVMLLAGGILFGGVIFAFRVLFSKTKRGEDVDFDPATRPDT